MEVPGLKAEGLLRGLPSERHWEKKTGGKERFIL